MKKISQQFEDGFAHLIPIVLVGLLFAGVATIGVSRYIQTKNKSTEAASSQAETNQAKTNNNTTTTTTAPVAQDTPSSEPAGTVATPVTDAEAAPVTTSPQPPAQAQSTASAFTAAHCVGKVTVYVSNASGAAASYHPPSTWSTVTTYPYGQALSAYCMISNSAFAPDYVIVDDAFVKSSDISPTKP